MATQALYRRYRPRRFSEVKGQDHVVRALRNAVINGREGQAYLFSGPRGTGKTTSARILAKVLNCERPVDGEPCCECDSCIAVEKGTSYDVHELDAASNNGVDAMRDLIEKASLGTPGRHRVYILDEVHMLSKGAEAALLKTLEEPPPHVVFVLATTDPHKVSDTIRSRTQHLQFHLLPMDVLEDHVRWLAADAGLELSDPALRSVLQQGGGSARDTISALELAVSTGGELVDSAPIDELVESLIDHDPGRALTFVAHAVQHGRDPRTLTEDVVRHLRDCFLSVMAPELVQLPAQRAQEVADQAGRLGAAATVRAMERLGEMLVDLRHAPDPRVLLEVALVQLTHQVADPAALLARIEKLEQAIAGGVAVRASPSPAPVDPATGRTTLGGRAKATNPGSSSPIPATGSTPVVAEAASSPAADSNSASPVAPVAGASSPREPRLEIVPPVEGLRVPGSDQQPSNSATESAIASEPESALDSSSGSSNSDSANFAYETLVRPSLKGMAKAMFLGGKGLGVRDGVFVIGFSGDAHRNRANDYRGDVERAMAAALGQPIAVSLVVDGSAHDPDDNVVQLQAAPAPPPDDEVDLTDLVDAPPESIVSPIDRIGLAFPGSELMDEHP